MNQLPPTQSNNLKTNVTNLCPTITLSTDETETIIQEGLPKATIAVIIEAVPDDVEVTLPSASIANVEATVQLADDDKNNLEINVTPPPLPVSPPPSQVVAFAIGSDATTTVIEEQAEEEQLQVQEKVLAPTTTILTNVIELVDDGAEEIPTIMTVMEVDNEAEEEKDTKQLDDNNEQIEVTAIATFMVDEITAKAATIIDGIQQASLKLVTEQQEEQEASETQIQTNIEDNKVDEVKVEGEEEEDEELDLPPPPTTPPSYEAEEEEQTEAESAVIPAAVEEVLNQFETKMNEIEQKVLEFESIASSLIEAEQIEDNKTSITREIENKEEEEEEEVMAEIPALEEVNDDVDDEKVNIEEENKQQTIDITALLVAEIDKLSLNDNLTTTATTNNTQHNQVDEQEEAAAAEQAVKENNDDEEDFVESKKIALQIEANTVKVNTTTTTTTHKNYLIIVLSFSTTRYYYYYYYYQNYYYFYYSFYYCLVGNTTI